MSYLRPAGQGMTVTGPEVEETYRNGAVVGFNNVYTYEGTESEIDSQRIIERASGATKITKRPTGTGLYQLVSSFPFDAENGSNPDTEEPQDLHEIEVQVEQIPAKNSERLRLFVSNDDIAVVEKYVDLYKSGSRLKDIPTNEWFGLRSGMQWLKANPTVQAAAGGKTQIQYYYTEFKQATKLFYEAYGSAVLLDSSATPI